MRNPNRSCLLACYVLLVGGVFSIPSNAKKTFASSYSVEIASEMEQDIEGQRQEIGAKTQIQYSWEKQGFVHLLRFKSMVVKATMNGESMMDTAMSREKFESTEDGERHVVSFDEAASELQAILRDTFDTPLCKRQVDENGVETNRTMLAGEGAKATLENGVVINMLLFHAPYFPNKAEWQADTEVSLGNGGVATGKLTYKKTTSEGKIQQVQVSGILTKDSVNQPGTPIFIRDTKYIVDGSQTYDLAQKDWVSGNLNFDLSFMFTADETPIGSAKGRMELNFKLLPDKEPASISDSK